jgi:AraC-like DNA-binding protein
MDSLVPPSARRPSARAQATEARTAGARAAAAATCSVRVIQPFVRYLLRNGCDAEAWLAAHGLTMAALAERDRRVPHAQAMALLRDAARLSGDPAIGIHAARCDEPGDFDVLEYAAANCASVGEALQLAARFIPLMHDGVVMELDVVPPLAALRVRPLWGIEHDAAAIEFLFASLLAYGSRSIGHPTRPLRVELAHAGPAGQADTRIYDEVFREVRFGCDANTMWLTASALELPHCAPDRSLLEILTNHGDALLRQLSPRPPGIAERARSVIAETLLAGHSGADQIARRLAVSLRTLHRRLAEEGTSHGELVDEVRREQAMLHLASNQFSIGEIAFLLGFSHPNGFHKAFKRWTRMTPVQYREAAQAPVQHREAAQAPVRR